MESGYYKLDRDEKAGIVELLYGKVITAAAFALDSAKRPLTEKDGLDGSVDGWAWFKSREDACAAFGVKIEEFPAPDLPDAPFKGDVCWRRDCKERVRVDVTATEATP
jgi:hypothetical protein